MGFLVIVSALILGSLVECRSPYPYRTGLIVPELQVLPPGHPGYGPVRPDLELLPPGHPGYGPVRPDLEILEVLPPGHPGYGPPGPPEDYQIQYIPAPPPPGLTCLQSCTITREYMPVCVTIGGVRETFSTRAAAQCAERCRGLPMTAATNGPCGPVLWDRRNLRPGMID